MWAAIQKMEQIFQGFHPRRCFLVPPGRTLVIAVAGTSERDGENRQAGQKAGIHRCLPFKDNQPPSRGSSPDHRRGEEEDEGYNN